MANESFKPIDMQNIYIRFEKVNAQSNAITFYEYQVAAFRLLILYASASSFFAYSEASRIPVSYCIWESLVEHLKKRRIWTTWQNEGSSGAEPNSKFEAQQIVVNIKRQSKKPLHVRTIVW